MAGARGGEHFQIKLHALVEPLRLKQTAFLAHNRQDFVQFLFDAFDRLLLNRFVNRVGSSSMVSAEGLRLAVSGQTQSYVLTVLLAIVLLLSALVWWRAA